METKILATQPKKISRLSHHEIDECFGYVISPLNPKDTDVNAQKYAIITKIDYERWYKKFGNYNIIIPSRIEWYPVYVDINGDFVNEAFDYDLHEDECIIYGIYWDKYYEMKQNYDLVIPETISGRKVKIDINGRR